MKRDGRVAAIQPLWRRVQQMKSFTGDPSDDLGVYSSPGPAFANGEKMTGSGYRLQNCLGIERLNSSQINNLDIDSCFFELGSRSQSIVKRGSVRDYGKIFSGAAA